MLSVSTQKSRRSSCLVLWWPVLLIVGSLASAAPAFGLWLPWATEKQKVQKTVDDIWQALIDNNRKVLNGYITGPGRADFIKQERDLIERMKITKYECLLRNMRLNTGSGLWAFVEVEKVGFREGGGKFTRRDLTVLQKVRGLWRLVTGFRKKKDETQVEAHAQIPGSVSASKNRGDGSTPAGASVNTPQ